MVSFLRRKKNEEIREIKRVVYKCTKCGKEYDTRPTQCKCGYEIFEEIEKEIETEPSKPRRVWNWLTEKRPSAESFYFIHVFPLLIGIVASIILFWVIFPNPFLFIGGLFFSISAALPKDKEHFAIAKAIFIFVSVLISWWGIQAFNKFVALLFLFFGYASLSFRPLSEESYAYEGAIALLKIILGGLIAFSPFLVFGLATDFLGWSLFLIGLGFFFLSFPEHHEIPAVIRGKGGLVTVFTYVYEKGKEHANSLGAFSFLLILAGTIVGGATIAQDFGLWAFRTILFGILGFTSAFVAFSTPGQHRGEVGFPLYLLLLFTVTTAYPDVLGQAVFGPWWPQISATIESVAQPLSTSFAQLRQGMSDMWLMFTCPSCYYEKMMEQQRHASQAVSSIYSIEGSISFLSTQINPEEPLTGFLTLSNQGDFEAEDIQVILHSPEIYIKKGKKYVWKPLSGVGASIPEYPDCNEVGKECSIGSLYPDEKRMLTVIYGQEKKQEEESEKGEKSGWEVPVEGTDLLTECKCKGVNEGCGDGLANCRADKCGEEKTVTDPDELEELISKYSALCTPVENGENGEKTYKCVISCSAKGGSLIFKYGGSKIRIPIEYRFKYSTNASLQILGMEKNLYQRLFKEGKITQRTPISKYSGGPVKASIWAGVEPIVFDSETSRIRTVVMQFTMTNEGTGIVYGEEGENLPTKITVTLPKETGEIKIYQELFLNCEKEDEKIICKLTRNLLPQQYAKVSFGVDLSLPKNIEQKTFTITANVDYTYGRNITRTFTFAYAPVT